MAKSSDGDAAAYDATVNTEDYRPQDDPAVVAERLLDEARYLQERLTIKVEKIKVHYEDAKAALVDAKQVVKTRQVELTAVKKGGDE